jgi:hypothetical protein
MKETKSNISVILPVHELTDETKQLFSNAIKSVADQKVIPEELVIVTPKDSETAKYIKSFEFDSLSEIVSIVENDGETDFASQINLGVSKAKCDWVSFLEFDDEYANIWFKNVVEYREAYENFDIFMPLIVDVDKKNSFIGFTNEAVWAAGFSDEMGVLDLNSLLTYQNFNIDGIVMRKSIFEEYGGFKPSIKLTFIYEFLLRMVFKDAKVMTIPRFGYKHANQRDGSLFDTYKNTIDPVEARWWLSQAKKEYYFNKDRNITYQA